MATPELIMIPLNLPRDEATAFAELLKRSTYDDCVRHSNRVRRYPDGRSELDVMWSAVQLVEKQFAEAGIAPRWRKIHTSPLPRIGGGAYALVSSPSKEQRHGANGISVAAPGRGKAAWEVRDPMGPATWVWHLRCCQDKHWSAPWNGTI